MEIKQYIAIIQRWLWAIIAGSLLVAIVIYLVNINTSPTYRASTRLLIDQAPGSGANDYAQVLFEQRLATTYVQLIKSYPVFQETIQQLNLPFTANQLSGRVTVSSPEDTQIIIITVVDTDPVRVAQIADTIGQVFIDQNRERQTARYAASITVWENRKDELEIELQGLEEKINALGTAASPEAGAELSILETNRREAQIRYTDAFNNLEQLRVEEAKNSDNLLVFEPAQIPPAPFAPRVLTNTLLGFIVGGLVALAIVFLIEYLDDTVKSPEQVLDATNLSTLGAIASIKIADSASRLVTFNNPRAPVSEAYRVLRTNLSFAAIDGGLHSILITSPSPSEGKSTTSANLSVVMAQTGKRVIIVDADLRRPTQHKIFGVSNNQGLTTALLDTETPLENHIQESIVPNLRVLTSGPIPPNPAELLNSHRMEFVLNELEKIADLIIFDTPPAMTVADASILAAQVDGSVLVTEAGHTRRQALAQAVETLQKSGGHLLGIVLNQIRPTRSGYYNYYYYRYYNYDYSSKPVPKRGLVRLLSWLPGNRS